MGLIRFILAISVVIAHSDAIFGVSLVGGMVAVLAFYIISGFYMALILNEKYIGANNSYRLFITSRMLRLYPVYWTVLLLTIIASIVAFIYTNGANMGGLQYYRDYLSTLKLSTLSFLIFSNLSFLGQDWVMFLGLDTSSGGLFFTPAWYKTDPMLFRFLLVPQAWTIGIEITFYAIAPFLVRRKLWIIIGLIILSLLLRLVLFQNGYKEDPWANRFFPTALVFFLLGIVGYHGYKRLQKIQVNQWYLKAVLGFIIGFTICYSYIPFQEKIFIYLFSVFICTPFVFLLSKNWKRDRYIGELSYPIYISHLLVAMGLKFLDLPEFGGGDGLALAVLTIFFSIALNELVAKKIEAFRQRRVMPVINKE